MEARRVSMASDDLDYLPPRYMGFAGARQRAGDDVDSDDWEVDSGSSDDSSSAAGARRKCKQASMGVRKPSGSGSGGVGGSGAGSGGGGGGGIRVLHRWTAEEHARLEALVRQYGTERNWALIADGIRGRSGKQCRERWLNHMREGIIKGNWLADEEFHLALCHTLVGNQWSQHCNRLRGRTENSIKNYWNATLRSKQPNKRRGFLWAYIDRVKGALDDEALRHRAFADTVAIVYGQTNDWLPAWLRAKVEASELELPRVGEGLGRGWRRLLDREAAFLRDRDADAASTGIPYPNPASNGVPPPPPAAPRLTPRQQQRRQAAGHHLQRPPPLQARERREAQPLYYDPGPASPSLLQVQAPSGPALGQQLQGPLRAPSLGLDLLGDAMLLGDSPCCYTGTEAAFASAGVAAPCACDAEPAARIAGGAFGMAGADMAGGSGSGDKGEEGGDEDELLVEELPDALMPDGGEAPSRAIMAPGLPRLVVTAPQGAWWGSGTGGVSLAAAVAAAAAGLGAPDAAAAAAAAAGGGASPPPLLRDSSFCGSVGSTGATPPMSRLRLASNSPAPTQAAPALELAAGAFGAMGAGAAAGVAAAFPAAALFAGLRPYQPSHLSTAASFGSDFSTSSALLMPGSAARTMLVGGAAQQALQPPPGWAGNPTGDAPSLYAALPALQLPLQLPQPLVDAAVAEAEAGPSGGCGGAVCTSPFGSPSAQGGEACFAWGTGLLPAHSPASAPPALGGLLPAVAPLLSRFAASAGRRNGAGGGTLKYPPTAGFGAPAGEAPLPWEAYTAAAMLQPQPRRSSADASAAMPAFIVPMRETSAGAGAGRQQALGAEFEAAHDTASPPNDAQAGARAARTSCCGSVGSGGDGCAAACDGAAAVAGGAGPAPMCLQVSDSLGFLTSASLGLLGCADSALLLLDGQPLSPDGFTNAGEGTGGAGGPTDA
ncbi:hypothetical protein Rsub_11155 [Raphidocelis subcapitata]|uniref:Transcription factor n=1 Tax=Raphidocelis subcapitata TaxID=307507 RepID=A0A2V0PGR6_9CHLO|nr:hypothetical protein Rsub_11155 [Raphidocelis subcapitata]|eukprot:GBF98749.1 hypothetical protein Rsub_11155 [Raphidocelis subcapitata]